MSVAAIILGASGYSGIERNPAGVPAHHFNHHHPVVRLGLRFLLDSARSDGSWPIDTNLATWVTTLAAPGGWAWTDLSGGVPDADGTAGAVLPCGGSPDQPPTTRCAGPRWPAFAGWPGPKRVTAEFPPSVAAGAGCRSITAAPI